MRNRDDWVELELTKQQARLKYIDGVLNRRTECDFRPRRVYFEPTNYCTLRCGHCAAHNGSMTRSEGMMDLALFKKVMEDIKDWNRTTEICLFQHGESTLHKDLPEMVRLSSVDYDFFTKLNTNGTLMTREMSEKLIRANIDALVFTLDAVTPETYHEIKGRPHFEKVMSNILDFLELWGDVEREFPNYFPCDMFLVEEARNRKEIPIIQEMFERLPIGHVQTYELFNYMGAVQEANGKYPERFTLPREEWPTCNTPWDVLGLRWNGDVVACIYDYDNRYVIGNVAEQSLGDIWNGERMQAFRRAQVLHQFDAVETKGPMCSNCTIMWQKPYQLPNDFQSEVGRMEFYLSAAIKRVSERHTRTADMMTRHAYLKGNREAWMAELYERIEPIRRRSSESP